jgi:hypothetical protein
MLILGSTGRTTNGASTERHDRVLLIARVLRRARSLVFDTSWQRSKLSAVPPLKGDVARGSDNLAQDLRLMPLPENLGVTLTAQV